MTIKCTTKVLVMLFLWQLISIQSIYAQSTVSGAVTSETNEAMPGVSVILKGTTQGTVTDQEGKYSISISDNSSVLVFSFVGYMTEEVQVDSKTVIDLVMNPDIQSLSEVVVTALGVTRDKRQLTYSTQEVKGEELVKSREPNVINALTGKVSGVQITSSSGTPGSSTRIVIRGATSIYGDNEALIVIDGIPVNNSETASPGGGAAGAGSSRLADIDPSIIESVNVLKGAAATALYGSAGARGVVMITTKGGNDKKPTISFSSMLSYETPLLPERQTKYAQGTNGIYYNGEDQKTSTSYGPLMDTLIIDGKKAPSYDPYKFFKTGVSTTNNLNIAGGSENSSYMVSYSYFDQQGIVPKSGFKRHSAFAKYTTKVYKNLNSTFQLQYSNSNQQRVPEGASNGPLFVLFGQPVSWNPDPYLNPDGTQRLYRYSRNNPTWVTENSLNEIAVNRFIPEMTLNYTPFSWLTITERLGADMFIEQIKYWETPSPAIGTLGRIINQNSVFRQFNNDLIISANKGIGSFNFNLLLGNNIFSSYNQVQNTTGNGLSVNSYHNVNGASTITSFEGHYLRRKVGFYAQVNIDYKSILNLSFTGRYDGSSVLSQDKSFYPYGSAAASFAFSELLPESVKSVLNFAKVRVSYATVGNDNVGAYSLNTPYVSSNINGILFPFNGQSGFLYSETLGNPNLRNERLNESEVGLESKLFNNRIGLEASYFYRKSVDGIIPGVAIAPSTGYNGTTVNTASIENKGFELLLNASPVKQGKFSWDLTFNYTKIRNKVLELYPGTDQLGRIIVGQPYNIFYGSRYKRNEEGKILIGEDGLPLRDDVSGIIGDVNPDWLAGLNNTLKYGGLSLSFFFDMRKGGDIQNDVDSYGYFYGTSKGTEDRTPKVIEGVRASDNQPNTKEVSAQAYYQFVNSIQESTIQDGTYIKLRNVSLSYDLGSSLLKKTPFKSISVIVTGRNLWIYSPNFSGADPEVSSLGSGNANVGIYQFSTPTSRSYGVTLRGTF